MSMSSLLVNYDTQINTILDTFLYGGFHSMVTALRTPFTLCAMLSIIILGFALAQGYIKTPFQEIVKNSIKIGALLFFFYNWGNFSHFIVKLFLDSANQLGSSLQNMLGVKMPTIGGIGGTTVGLQVVLNEINQVASALQHRGSLTSWAPYIDSIFIFISGHGMVVVSYFELLMAKITINVLLITAPLFAIFCLFKPTQGWFSKWLGTIAGASFVIIFVSAIVCLNVSILQGILLELMTHTLKNLSFVPIVIVSVLSILMCLRISSIAYSMGGAVSHGAGSAAVGAFVGASLGRARSAGRFATAPVKAIRNLGKATFNRFK